MNLTESYNELYTVCKAYNELVAEKGRIEKRFSNLESFLKRNQSEIEKYGLIPDIKKMFGNKELSVSQIENLIKRKREEEKELERKRQEDERERKRREEEARRLREEQERQRLKQEEEARRLREEQERQRREAEEERRKKIIKWALIVVAVFIVAFILVVYVIPFIIANIWWILLVIAVIGFIIYKISK